MIGHGGLLKVVSFTCPIKGFLACLGDLHQTDSKRVGLSLGRIVPRVTMT